MRRAVSVAAVAAVALLAAATTTWAGGAQTFSDVPPENPFFDEIEAISAAGITNGFNDGTYRPSQSVTRGAMAAFMGRGFGRTDLSADSGFTLSSGTSGLSDVSGGAGATITAGASGTGGGFVVIQAMVKFSVATESICPCFVVADVSADDGPTSPNFDGTLNENANEGGTVTDTVAVLWMDPITAGETRTYDVRADVVATSGSANASVSNNLTLLYVPFDGTGNTPGA